jgi:formylglycine-generating enzyme required for sulfatase activity
MVGKKIAQLQRALDAGVIDQATFEAAVAGLKAHLVGSGAIAQGEDSRAFGERAVAVDGDVNADINTGLIINLGTRPGASKDDLRRAYLARTLSQVDQLPLFAADGGKAQIKLSSIYTALLTQRSEEQAQQRRARDLIAHRAERLSALDLLNIERKLVLLGGPGSGKSTFVSFVALCMAGELLGATSPNLKTLTAPLPPEEDNREKPKRQSWDHGALEPVHIVLRDFASQLPKPGVEVNAGTMWSHIAGSLQRATLGNYADHLHDHLLKRGGLILLDGLDEVPDQDRRLQIKQAVQDFAASFAKCRFLVTSRTYAYQRQDWKLDGFAETQLLPFTPGQIAAFVDAWYGHMVQLERLPEAAARDRGDALKRAARQNRHVGELAERPLLLTLIAKVQTDKGGVLPEKREELYDKALELLLNEWESMKVRVREDGSKDPEPSLAEWLKASRDDIRRQLNRLAFEAHRDQPQLVGTADIQQKELTNALLDASPDRANVRVGQLEAYLRARAGILAAHGVGMYQFPHRSFQEYLAACHLTDDDFPAKLAELARNDANRWREVALLAGAKAARGSSQSAWTLSEALCLKPPPRDGAEDTDHWGALLAGQVLVESTDYGKVAQYNTEKLERAREWQRTIMRRNTLPAIERALAGRTLAALGDPRPEVMTLDGMEFCFLPPGPFLMGDDRDADNEKPQHTVELDYPYFIARFPVSVAQWREYLERSGRALDDNNSARGRANDPVTEVIWHDAKRFGDYLTQKWRWLLPEGFAVVLPSEAEWEKAARGGKRVPPHPRCVSLPQLIETVTSETAGSTMANPFPARAYPWGDLFDLDKANAEGNVAETSALGGHPYGDSPYGCEEMSGNVWEWTRSLYGFDYPYDPNDRRREDLTADNEQYRVLRGGAWSDLRGVVRCAFRGRGRPDDRFVNVGFRVVLRSAPVP